MKWFLIIVFCFSINFCFTQSIVNTKHNLSVDGPGSYKATSESEVCIFCHVPHNSSPTKPLWNRGNPGSVYTLYQSSTLQASPGQPTGVSLMCLSCHDGTVALGNIASSLADIPFNSTHITGNSNLSVNLSNDHPISFIYPNNDDQLRDAALITPPVRLLSSEVHCTSCHDPHNNTFSPFLVTNNQGSGLCNSCHNRTGWSGSAHQSSNNTWNGAGSNPWFHTSYTKVSDNACENCHNPHNANGSERLMKYAQEEANCLDCHNGNVASTNIQAQLAKSFRHKVGSYSGIHEPFENAEVTVKHVECEDCHNPHSANSASAVAPYVKGSISGVKGISIDGNPVAEAVYEYEICLRCHDNPNFSFNMSGRQINQNSLRLLISTSNASYHPFAGPGKNSDVPSLIAPLTEASYIYCSDCHSSDGAGAPKGPHGSTKSHLLKLNYRTADVTAPYVSSDFDLCYSCHSEAAILGDATFVHSMHVVNSPSGFQMSCNTCHDPHGVPSGIAAEHSSLINFSSEATYEGVPMWTNTGGHHGSCTLTCHGYTHSGSSY